MGDRAGSSPVIRIKILDKVEAGLEPCSTVLSSAFKDRLKLAVFFCCLKHKLLIAEVEGMDKNKNSNETVLEMLQECRKAIYERNRKRWIYERK